MPYFFQINLGVINKNEDVKDELWILAVTYFLCSVFRTMVHTRKAKDDEAVLPTKFDVCNLIHTPGALCPTTTQAKAVQEKDQEGKAIEKQNEPIHAEIPAPEESAATTGARGKYLADFLTVGYKYCRNFTFNSGLGARFNSLMR